jgi:ADP-ribose pyrophosphatase YjhB (NUDIX family)
VSAGGIVFKRTEKGVAFAMLKDSYGNWTFPKGHVHEDESHRQGAQREIFEEMGLKGLAYHGKLGHIDIWFRDRFEQKGTLIHKYIYYFLFEAKEMARLRRPAIVKGEEKIQAVAWVPVDRLMKRSSYRDMDEIVQRALLRVSRMR